MRKHSTRVIRPIHFPMLVKAETVLRPLEEIIEQIDRHGTVEVQDGLAVFFNHADAAYYGSAAAIAGLADAFDMWAIRHGKELNTAPLRRLAESLASLSTVTETNLADLHALLPRLRRAAATFQHDDASDLIRQTQIKAEMERVG